jgi:hypothetical protein
VKVSFLLATAAALLCSLMPVRAQTVYYPTQWCRVYDDTVLTQIPGQCGTVMPYYPRRLLVRSWRRLPVIYGRY